MASQKNEDYAFRFWDDFTDFLVFWLGPMRFEHPEAGGGRKAEFQWKVTHGDKKIRNKPGQTRTPLGRKWAQLRHVRVKKKKKSFLCSQLDEVKEDVTSLGAGIGKKIAAWTGKDPMIKNTSYITEY